MDSNLIYDHQNVILGLAPVLTYAACEWFLMFLMLIDALLSYLLVWFARYCRLPLPCFLCSKLLHPLHWRLLLCRNHRSEVSSYISCLNHDNNLADCRGMCDDCLLSFTKTTGPDPDMNRLLLGKLGYDLLSTSQFSRPRSCSCCDKPWRTRNHTQRLVRLGSRGAAKPNIPAPRHHHLTRRGSGGSLKKMRNSHKADVGSRSDGMAHVGYAELKIHSESESDFLFTDDDALMFQTIDFSAAEPPSERRVHHKSRSRRGSFDDDKKMLKRKQTYVHDDNVHVKDHKLEHKTRKQQQPKQPIEADVISELITMSEARPFSLDLPKEESAGGAVAQSEYEAEVSGSSSPSGGEFLSPSGDNSVSHEIQIQAHDDSADSAVEIEVSEVAVDQNEDSADFAQNITRSAAEIEASEDQKVSEHTDVAGSVEDEPSSDKENVVEGDFKPLTTNDTPASLADEPSRDEENGAEGDLKPLKNNDEESNEVNENNVAEEYFSNEEEDEAEVNAQSEPSTSKDVSGSFAVEQSSHEEEDVDSEDSEPLTSNNATGSTSEEPSGKEENAETEPLTSPKNSNEGSSLEHSDDKDSSKATETLNTSKETPELKQSASVESFVSISSDIEGENLVDLLKQQLEHNRKSLKDVSKELEEERNASAIAANQAMAMITRLQEEKAALHMEALQYLRMMDEQAEHDVDALERANDVLADREKEIQDLEMELEYYRVKYPDEPREEILASMGILEDVETSGNSTTGETSEKVATDI